MFLLISMCLSMCLLISVSVSLCACYVNICVLVYVLVNIYVLVYVLVNICVLVYVLVNICVCKSLVHLCVYELRCECLYDLFFCVNEGSLQNPTPTPPGFYEPYFFKKRG